MASDSSDAYHCRPGICVIINNMKFDDPRLIDLPSGKKDEAILKSIFALLDFDIKVHQNLTVADMKSIAKRYSKMEHTGAFFLIISSHGGEGDVVCGTDGGEVKVHDLQKYFHATKCPSLAGIPKVFMIDACRGGEDEPVYHVTPRSTSKSGPQSSSTSSTASVTDSADIMTIFASTRGNVSWCNEDKGSYLIQTFAKVLEEASINDNLMDIIMKVQKEFQELKVQTPQLESTCTRHYCIKRGTKLNSLLTLNKELQEAFDQWLPVRQKTITEIRKVAEKLREHHSNVNATRIAGSAASIAGGIIIALALTPVSFGGSLALAGVGIGVSAVGGATVAGASIVDIFIEKTNLKDVQTMYDKDQHRFKKVLKIITEMKKIVESVYRKYPEMEDELVFITTQFFSGAVRTGNLDMRLAELAAAGSLEVWDLALRLGGAAAKGITAVATVPSVFEIVESSFSLKKGYKTKAINMLLEHAIKLEEQKEGAKRILDTKRK